MSGAKGQPAGVRGAASVTAGGFLLDTDVLSELRKPRPAASVLSFVAGLPLEDLFVSEVTFSEIRFGIERIGDPLRRAALHDWLAQKLRPMFEQRALPVTEDILFKWRLLVEQGRRVGYTYSQPDLIIAATALRHGLTIATRDTGDYQRAGVPSLNPWLRGA